MILFVLILFHMYFRFQSKYQYQPSLDYQKTKRQLFRIKNKKFPPIPKTIEAMHEALEKPEVSKHFRLTLDKNNDLYVGSVLKKNHSFIVFASHRIIEISKEFIPLQSRKYLIDGTFKVVPRVFYQLLVISIEYKNDVSVSNIFSDVVSGRNIFVAIIFSSLSGISSRVRVDHEKKCSELQKHFQIHRKKFISPRTLRNNYRL